MGQKAKYIGQKELKTKKLIIITIAVLTVMLASFLITLNLVNTQNEEKQQAIMTGQFNSIRDILEYYGCQFKGYKDSEVEGFELDIYTIFKYDLYDNEKSNEQFYNNVINKIAEFLDYNSFRMIDNSREEKIEIQVICAKNKIQTIYINGREDYFIYMDSRISLSKYKELKTSEFFVQSKELVNCIENNWTADCDFGTRESIFQDYYIYFDEGIQTRKISGKIYNIVFTNKYVNPVINGFTVGTNRDIIISELGIPTFQSDDKSIIGYKSKDMYVFFEKDQISIYRNNGEDGFDEFFALVDNFLDDKYSLLEFMNELTYIWPDYEEYFYDAETVFLSYPNKGIDVKINYDDMDGIILYNNIGVNQEIVNKYLEHTEFVAQLQVDNVYNAEQRRIKNQNEMSVKCKQYKEEFEKDDDRNRGEIYNYYMKLDSNNRILNMYFISQNPQFVNCELSENIDTYIWLNDYCFVYSKSKKGIYYYDLKNQIKGTIITGEDEYKIKAYENGILKYDEKQLQIQY